MSPVLPLCELARQLGLPPLALDAQDGCGLRLDGVDLDLHFPAHEDCVRLTGWVGIATDADRGQLLASLLVANLFLTEHGRPHAAFDPVDGQVALSQSVPLDPAQPQALAAEVRRFAAACRGLREQLGGQLLPAA
jgi:hypothetical protein